MHPAVYFWYVFDSKITLHLATNTSNYTWMHQIQAIYIIIGDVTHTSINNDNITQSSMEVTHTHTQSWQMQCNSMIIQAYGWRHSGTNMLSDVKSDTCA